MLDFAVWMRAVVGVTVRHRPMHDTTLRKEITTGNVFLLAQVVLGGSEGQGTAMMHKHSHALRGN